MRASERTDRRRAKRPARNWRTFRNGERGAAARVAVEGAAPTGRRINRGKAPLDERRRRWSDRSQGRDYATDEGRAEARDKGRPAAGDGQVGNGRGRVRPFRPGSELQRRDSRRERNAREADRRCGGQVRSIRAPRDSSFAAIPSVRVVSEIMRERERGIYIPLITVHCRLTGETRDELRKVSSFALTKDEFPRIGILRVANLTLICGSRDLSSTA